MPVQGVGACVAPRTHPHYSQERSMSHDVNNHCPACGTRLDLATGIGIPESAAPKKGDITICWYCSNVAAFTEGLELRPLTEAEAAEIEKDPIVIALREEVRHAQRKHRN